MKLKYATFLDLASLHRGDLNLDELESVVAEWQWFDKISRQQMSSVLASTEVIVSNKVFLGAEQIQQAPHLKLICIAATGTNNVDLEAAATANDSVCNVQATLLNNC